MVGTRRMGSGATAPDRRLTGWFRSLPITRSKGSGVIRLAALAWLVSLTAAVSIVFLLFSSNQVAENVAIMLGYVGSTSLAAAVVLSLLLLGRRFSMRAMDRVVKQVERLDERIDRWAASGKIPADDARQFRGLVAPIIERRHASLDVLSGARACQTMGLLAVLMVLAWAPVPVMAMAEVDIFSEALGDPVETLFLFMLILLPLAVAVLAVLSMVVGAVVAGAAGRRLGEEVRSLEQEAERLLP